MKIKWYSAKDKKTYDITEFVSTITWGGSASQAARTLEISVIYSPYDKNIKDPNIRLGDRLKLYDNSNRQLIDIMVYYRERNGEQGTITYSGYDGLNHLLKSNGTYHFKNTTAEKITRKICNDLQVSIGSIKATNVNIKKFYPDGMNHYDIIINAYRKAHKSNGKKYMVIMSGHKLNVIEKGEVIDDFYLDGSVNIKSSSYTESLDSMINRVKIYNDKGKLIGEVKNDDWIKAYGVFQDVYTKEDGVNAKSAAEKILKGIDKTASVEAIGNVNCISGYGIKIKDAATKLTGVFWIENDTHTFENGTHMMSLELTFQNIMDTGG
jgi:hypothetical protein